VRVLLMAVMGIALLNPSYKGSNCFDGKELPMMFEKRQLLASKSFNLGVFRD